MCTHSFTHGSHGNTILHAITVCTQVLPQVKCKPTARSKGTHILSTDEQKEMYMYVCMRVCCVSCVLCCGYVNMCANTFKRTHIHTYTRTHMYTHTHIHTHRNAPEDGQLSGRAGAAWATSTHPGSVGKTCTCECVCVCGKSMRAKGVEGAGGDTSQSAPSGPNLWV